MQVTLRSFFLLLAFSGCSFQGIAQTNILTQAVAVTSVCPNTSIDIPFSLTGTIVSGDRFSIQFARGSEVTTLPAGTVIGNLATGQYTATITLTSPLTSGTYKIRVVTSSPAVIGSESPTSIFLKTQPANAPALIAQFIGNFTSQYTFCQNDSPLSLSSLVVPAPDNYRILYDQGTALVSTGQRTYTAPIINTSTIGKTTYNFRYDVIDATKGCNLSEQAGAVSYLNTEVKLRPAAPAPALSSLTYCQNQTASPLVATAISGAELTWYNASGAVMAGGSPIPPTTTIGTAVYQVTQSLDRCESPSALVRVTVQTGSTPPVVANTRIELCRGANTQPLSATGTNLIWTDPTGTTSTVAPTPSTLNASKSVDGDIYYVSQGGGSGCNSAPLAIRVLVQAQPTLSLSGGTNINLGLELSLKLAFTGMGPYQYKVTTSTGSTTLTGTATKDTTLVLMPSRSVVYQVSEVSNKCGIGLPGNPATATVTVLIPTIRTLTLQSTTACAGNIVTATFQTTGTFNLGNAFRLQVARTNPDTAKISYSDLVIVQQVGTSQLTGVLPATATSGAYLVRVSATNPKYPIIGTPSAATLIVLGQSTAALTTTTPTISDGDVAKLSVSFTGDGPWTFTYRDSTDASATVQTITTNANPYALELKPHHTTTYRLTSISNGCTLNTNIAVGVTIKVDPLLAVEPFADQISIYPVPASTQLTVRIDPSLLVSTVSLLVINEKGNTVLTQETRQQHTELPLGDQPTGVYMLQIMVNGQRITRKFVKQ